MNSNNPLSRHVHAFFQDYLKRQRDLSPNTILSYRDTLKLFLQFASKHLGKPVVALTPEMLDVELVLVFLDYLEAQRNNSPATRNLRLAALRTFFGYVGGQDPLLLDQCRRIVDIPLKRVATLAVDYLEQEELEAVLDAIDRSTRGGRRDFVLVSLAYQTGARVQELLSLRAGDLQLTPPAWVRLFGKGRKERLVPLWNQTADLLRTLLVERNITAQSSSWVFANLRGQPLTRWGFRHLLDKHVRAAAAICPSIAAKRVHPHVLRHTTAVHMLQAGADPNSIRDFLGHASSETTWRYARITMQMKRKAAEALAPDSDTGDQRIPVWHENEAVLAYLESLGRTHGYVANLRQQDHVTEGLNGANST